MNFNASDPGLDTGESQDGIGLLKALNAAGTTPTALFGDATADTTYNGDLIELGFFKDLGDDGAIGGSGADADTASSTAFKGLWTPLTSKTTIGHDASIITSMVPTPTTTEYTIPNGEFGFNVVINNNNSPKDDDTAYINPGGASTNYSIDDQQTGGGHLDISDNYALLEAATNPLLGIRFYDINTANFTSGGTTKATDGSTRYNTIMDAAWVWPGNGASPLNMAIYEKNSGAGTPTLDASLEFEFDNTSAYTANIAQIGTGNTRIENDDYVATVTYFNDSAGAVTLDLDGGVGSTVVSGFRGTNTSSKITGGDSASVGRVLTLHSAAGNTGTDAFEFVGDIYESDSASSDLSIVKTGTGDQILSGNIDLYSSNSQDEGFINLLEGGLTLNPGSGETQVIEYLKGASGTTLTLDSTGAGTIELGFAQSQSGATFSGNVVLTGTGSSNIIKVATGSTAADYEKEQVFDTGVISGSEKLTKSGVGRLKLTGDNTFSGGMDIDDGTVVAGHADALGGSGNTVTINKGKLEVSSGITLANNTIQGGSGKSIIGGDGTVGTITIGGDANEIDYVSPGRGISSSLTPSVKQVDLDANSGSDAIGSFSATALSLNGGGVFDWQIQDFTGGAGGAGTKYDVLNFETLTFEAGQTFTINLMALNSTSGNAGFPDNAGNLLNSYQGTNGFLLLNNNNGSGITWNGWGDGSAGVISNFNVNSDDSDYHAGNWYGDWNVWYNGGGDFYLQYSAVPEPSTYIMVTGLFMLPGYRWIRRFRKKIKSADAEFDEV
ncbi:MAG: hypothetical protein HN548_01870 [Opitutae bacterium]|nr:hypothetical protein [Opitutae bacterium]